MGSDRQSRERANKPDRHRAPAEGRGEAVEPAITPEQALLHLQRTAGNRAVAAVLRSRAGRSILRDPDDPSPAEELREAIEGWGTDEATIYRVLGANAGSTALRTQYRDLTGRSLESDLRDDMSGSDLDRALRLYFGHTGSIWDTAVRLKDAMEGAGTDEDTVFEILRAQGLADARTQLREAYRDASGRSLRSDIEDDFSGDELTEALLAYEEGPLTPVLRDAIQLRDAMAGLGTDEATVFRVLEGAGSPAALDAVKEAYQRLTTRSLEADINDDFSGEELTRALQLIGVGTFENELPQDMFEGQRTVVRGLFDWRLEAGELRINVDANFVPDTGVNVPLATWQGEIDAVWNQYALREPGGLSIPIEMSLTQASGGKTIRVVQNANPGTYAPPDRANAAKWYPVMPSDTAPHEYGHLIGLPDEYQRTQEDFEEITGSAPTGPTNTSGQSEDDIADDLHTALTGANEAQRAANATTVLTNVGLIVGGMPQQGDFAQAVMTAYDADNSPNLQDTLAALPRAGRWTLQSVFSYASGTVMGDTGMVAHEHPVAARHLREFVNIAAARFPTYEWTTGPR